MLIGKVSNRASFRAVLLGTEHTDGIQMLGRATIGIVSKILTMRTTFDMDTVMDPYGRHAEVNPALLKQFDFHADREPDANCRCGVVLLVGFEEDD